MLRLAPRFDEAATTMTDRLDGLREVQATWGSVPLERRLEVAQRIRRLIVESEQSLIDTVTLPQRASAAETVSAELLPLADACRFLTRSAAEILKTRRLGSAGRPFWLSGSDAEVVREPWGLVLIIGPSNYPLLLPGVQMLQAIIAGNAVALKPGRGAGPAADALSRLFEDAGAPAGLIAVLDDSVVEATSAIDAGVDRVVLTGSATAGCAVLTRLAPKLTPAVMELSGCDAVFVGHDADVDLAARALRFGLCFNGGYTCIAPRRVFVAAPRAAELENRLVQLLEESPAIPLQPEAWKHVRSLVSDALDHGARLSCGELPSSDSMRPLVLTGVDPEMQVARADVSAPLLSILPVEDDAHAVRWSRACRYRLGATIFGSPREARRLADKVDAGCVVINDMIVPTADPRLPFGGRSESGYGVTRGAEGLLEMTRPKTVILRRGSFRPHFDPSGPEDHRLMSSFLRVSHGGSIGIRLRAGMEIFRLLLARGRQERSACR